jgi:ABC-type proline/glycine betaine transport system ATPase subunit
MAERRKQLAGTMSGGEQQMCAIGRALMSGPKLLLLDEPMGSLDRVSRDRLVSQLAEIIDQLGLTVVYVTHDRSEAFELADRIAVLDQGRLVQLAAPEILEAQPANAHVAHLLGHR